MIFSQILLDPQPLHCPLFQVMRWHSLAIGWMTRSDSHDVEGILIFTSTSQMVLSPSQTVIQSISGTPSPGLKVAGV
jgi:hypothetical protein